MGRWRFFSSLGEINDLLLGDFPLPGLILNGQTWWLNYGKGKIRYFDWAIFNGYVSLPEGKTSDFYHSILDFFRETWMFGTGSSTGRTSSSLIDDGLTVMK